MAGGRPGVGLRQVTVGLPEGCLAEIDRVGGEGQRSRVIRRIVEEWYEGRVSRNASSGRTVRDVLSGVPVKGRG